MIMIYYRRSDNYTDLNFNPISALIFSVQTTKAINRSMCFNVCDVLFFKEKWDYSVDFIFAWCRYTRITRISPQTLLLYLDIFIY